jgi:hypothetical protein
MRTRPGKRLRLGQNCVVAPEHDKNDCFRGGGEPPLPIGATEAPPDAGMASERQAFQRSIVWMWTRICLFSSSRKISSGSKANSGITTPVRSTRPLAMICVAMAIGIPTHRV